MLLYKGNLGFASLYKEGLGFDSLYKGGLGVASLYKRPKGLVCFTRFTKGVRGVIWGGRGGPSGNVLLRQIRGDVALQRGVRGKEAWPFYRTSSGLRLWWELEEPKKGPKGLIRFTRFTKRGWGLIRFTKGVRELPGGGGAAPVVSSLFESSFCASKSSMCVYLWGLGFGDQRPLSGDKWPGITSTKWTWSVTEAFSPGCLCIPVPLGSKTSVLTRWPRRQSPFSTPDFIRSGI
ncbi:hypothetical protein T484DRAFT_2107655 [Baffinella frigidus]|nr:hypothetical protein T484DRAFT_2107655 [Cryptophyta sp. CCMP2293]